jgi:hypothetical protein
MQPFLEPLEGALRAEFLARESDEAEEEAEEEEEEEEEEAGRFT